LARERGASRNRSLHGFGHLNSSGFCPAAALSLLAVGEMMWKRIVCVREGTVMQGLHGDACRLLVGLVERTRAALRADHQGVHARLRELWRDTHHGKRGRLVRDGFREELNPSYADRVSVACRMG
jgi:hypothetical protein